MSTIAILCAMDKEIERIIFDFGAVCIDEKERIYKAKLQAHTLVASVCGIGKVNSAIKTQRLIDLYKPDYVINCGVAGGLDKSLSVLDVVVAAEACYHDFHPVSLLEEDDNLKTSVFKCSPTLVECAVSACEELLSEGSISHFVRGRVVSGDSFVESDEVSRRIREELRGTCVEMEGAAIAQTCIVNGVEFLVLRAISDFADNSAEMTYDNFSNRAAGQAVEVLKRLILKIRA